MIRITRDKNNSQNGSDIKSYNPQLATILIQPLKTSISTKLKK